MSRSMPRPGQALLATGFVADLPEDGATFPSVGGNSGDPRVQAIYRRCMAALFARGRKGSPRNMDEVALRALAMACCGVPKKGMGKVFHDGLRQVAAKAGLYK